MRWLTISHISARAKIGTRASRIASVHNVMRQCPENTTTRTAEATIRPKAAKSVGPRIACGATAGQLLRNSLTCRLHRSAHPAQKKEVCTMASFRVSLLFASILVLGVAGEARAESVTVTKAVQDACA